MEVVMKVCGLAVVFLAVYLIIIGVVGLLGVAVSPILGVILNILALAAGVLFLVGVGKCHHDFCEKCKCEKCDIDKR